MVPMMTQRFADVGITYSLGGLTGNTLSSHRLSTYAYSVGGEELQDKVMEQLMKAYFSDEKYLNDRSVLLEAATEAGLPNAEAVIDDPNVMNIGTTHIQSALFLNLSLKIKGLKINLLFFG
mmetsp:Transcript_28176/g.36442  ORF Transcript_28176/g.36442 Transcript_28176/m.36442 type:complete len:121 (+) Transcript_28176:248-610(+)